MRLTGLHSHFFLLVAVMSFPATGSPVDCSDASQDRERCAEAAGGEPEAGVISQERSRERMAVLGSFSRQSNIDELLNRLELLVERENLPLRPVTSNRFGSSATRVGLAGLGSANVGNYLQTIKALGFPDVWITYAEVALPPRSDSGETSGGEQLMPVVKDEPVTTSPEVIAVPNEAEVVTRVFRDPPPSVDNVSSGQAAEDRFSISLETSGSSREDPGSEQLRAEDFLSDERAPEEVLGAVPAPSGEPVYLTEPADEQGEVSCTGTTEEILNCSLGDVRRLLKNWVLAWGAGDIEAYLSFYTKARSPRDDMNRSQWEANRRQRVSPDRDVEINLKLESLGIGDSGLFDVVFRQEYISPNYQDNVRKRLFLLREADGLKIWKEEVLP